MNQIIGISIAAISLFITIYFAVYRAGEKWGSLDRRVKVIEDNQDDIKRLSDICTRLTTQIEPFWALVEKQLASIVHSPHTPKIDALLEKLPDIDRKDAKELDKYLDEEYNTCISVGDSSKGLVIALLQARLKVKYNDFSYNLTCCDEKRE